MYGHYFVSLVGFLILLYNICIEVATCSASPQSNGCGVQKVFRSTSRVSTQLCSHKMSCVLLSWTREKHSPNLCQGVF